MEIYMPPFEGAVEANALSIMCANNRANQYYSCENHHAVQQLLRSVVVSEQTSLADVSIANLSSRTSPGSCAVTIEERAQPLLPLCTGLTCKCRDVSSLTFQIQLNSIVHRIINGLITSDTL